MSAILGVTGPCGVTSWLWEGFVTWFEAFCADKGEVGELDVASVFFVIVDGCILLEWTEGVEVGAFTPGFGAFCAGTIGFGEVDVAFVGTILLDWTKGVGVAALAPVEADSDT